MQNDRNGLSSSSLSGNDRGSHCLFVRVPSRGVSMATSDAQNLPRDTELLFSATGAQLGPIACGVLGCRSSELETVRDPLEDDPTDEIGE